MGIEANGAASLAGGWTRVGNEVIDLIPQIGMTAAGIFAILARHANHKNECWPSFERLGRLSGLKRRAIQLAIKALSNADLIVVAKGKRGMNHYVLIASSPPEVRKKLRDTCAKNCAPDAQKIAPRTRPLGNKTFGEQDFDLLEVVSSEEWRKRFFELLGSVGNCGEQDTAFVGQLAWLLEAGANIWPQVRDAIAAVKMVSPRPDNPVGYIRKCLIATIGREMLASYLRHAPKRNECRAKLRIVA